MGFARGVILITALIFLLAGIVLMPIEAKAEQKKSCHEQCVEINFCTIYDASNEDCQIMCILPCEENGGQIPLAVMILPEASNENNFDWE